MIYESTESFEQYDVTERIQCRICLEQVVYSTQLYCQCRGNHRNVHETCLIQWAKRAIKFRDEARNIYFNCDICKARIYIQFLNKCKVKDSNEISLDIRENCCQVSLTMVIFLLFLFIFIFCVKMLIKDQTNNNIVLGLAIVSAIMMIFILVLFSVRLLLKTQIVIDGFTKGSKNFKNNKIANTFSQSHLG